VHPAVPDGELAVIAGHGRRREPPAATSMARVNVPWAVLVIAGLVIIAVGLRAVSATVAPLFLAVTLVISVDPLRKALVRRGAPAVLAVAVVMFSVYLIIVAVLGAVAWSLAQLVQLVPTYQAEIATVWVQLQQWLSELGVDQADVDTLLNQFDPTSIIGVVQSTAGQVNSVLSLLTLLLISVVFLASDATGFGRRLASVRDSRPAIADGLSDFAVRVRRYWVVSTIFGLIVAVLDGFGLWLLGVPLPVTWAVLAFVTNYIPNIGFVLGLIPPALIALLDGGLSSMLWVIALYSVLNVVIQTFIQPRFTGDAAGINPTVTFISLLIWAYLLGALGALLAVPATLLLKCLAVDHNERARWINALISSETPTSPENRARTVDKV
jgi:predicted PurR-regulated permease PerM